MAERNIVRDDQAASLFAKLVSAGDTAVEVDGFGAIITTTRAGKRLAAQKFFIGSTGRLTLNVAGNIRATFRNTGAKNIVIVRMTVVNSNQAMGWADVRLNPTTGLPPVGAIKTPMNAVILAADNNNTSIAELRADTDTTTALGGGTLKLQVASTPNARTVFDLGLIITPGVTIGFNAAYAGAADGAITVYYYEEA